MKLFEKSIKDDMREGGKVGGSRAEEAGKHSPRKG